jgi:zinc transport system ATP-binding protein
MTPKPIDRLDDRANRSEERSSLIQNLSNPEVLGRLNATSRSSFMAENLTVQVKDLTVYRGNYLALRDVSFELPAGTNTAVVGPNGAGKSTLVQSILGLIPRATGTVEIIGRSPEKLGGLRSRIGYVPQNFKFDRTFPISVAEFVGLGWKKRGKSRQKFAILDKLPWKQDPQKIAAVEKALQRVDADRLKERAIGQLSGGQLKRILLAYCLVTPKDLLVLDEALAGVDLQGESDFYRLLEELKREQNWTILQISHDLDMVNRHCDRVLCLNQTIVCSGHPDIALHPDNLLATYGPEFARYRHHH